MRLGTTELEIGNEQAVGERAEQQDYFGIELAPDASGREGQLRGAWLVLSDGMGGHAGGADASVIAVDAFLEGVRRDPASESEAALEEAVRGANARVVDRARGTDMGATLVAVQCTPTTTRWVSVGDSRIYRLRSGELQRLNRDHNIQGELELALREGRPLPAEGTRDPSERRMLTSYLGLEVLPAVDVGSCEEIRPGDVVLLCSDGLTDALGDGEIVRILSTGRPAAGLARDLVERALDKGRPKQDNVSVVVLSGRQATRKAARRPSPGARSLLVAVATLVGVAVLALLLFVPTVAGLAYLNAQPRHEAVPVASSSAEEAEAAEVAPAEGSVEPDPVEEPQPDASEDEDEDAPEIASVEPPVEPAPERRRPASPTPPTHEPEPEVPEGVGEPAVSAEDEDDREAPPPPDEAPAKGGEAAQPVPATPPVDEEAPAPPPAPAETPPPVEVPPHPDEPPPADAPAPAADAPVPPEAGSPEVIPEVEDAQPGRRRGARRGNRGEGGR